MNRVRSAICDWRLLAVVCLAVGPMAGAQVPPPPSVAAGVSGYYLVDNFTTPLPSETNVKFDADFQHPKVGLASGQVTYTLDRRTRQAVALLPDHARVISGPGTLKLWVKGDGSGNEMELVIRHAPDASPTDARRPRRSGGDLSLPRIKLDFTDWREVSLDASALPADQPAWWSAIRFFAASPDRGATTAPSTPHTILLDDLRLYPTAAAPAGAFFSDLIGPTDRTFTKEIAACLDVRSFADRPAKLRARIILTDRNDNTIADREFPVELKAREARELKLDVSPDNLDSFIPPFKMTVDVVSSDLPDLTTRFDRTLVMCNSIMLVDDFSDVTGRWFTAGYGQSLRNMGPWISWLHGEAQRCNVLPQTSARISRVAIDPAEASADPSRQTLPPLVGHAMKLDFVGDAAVYNGLDRELPGQPYRLGIWVKGEGSSAQLSVIVMDHSDLADSQNNGWKRIQNAELPVCTLDFIGWRYCQVELPGHGLGVWSPRGNTDGIDMPLEISAFKVIVGKDETIKNPGSVLIGPIYVQTQQAASGALALQVGYDDTDLRYAANQNAWCTIQNGWYAGTRQVRANWTLLDRADQVIVSGQVDAELPAGQQKTLPIRLADHAAQNAGKAGPLRLQVTASDLKDVSASPVRQIMLAVPDSVVPLTDFEADRGYMALKGIGMDRATLSAGGEPVAFTSTNQAHTALRSLAIAWDKLELSRRFIAVDPQIPGVPVELSMWVHGDGSGALFYPILGDRRGVNKGLNLSQWDLFLARTIDGPLANVVKVDWTGWRQLKFRLPAIPTTWKKELPVLGFVPDYPLGVHLVVLADEATGESGTIYVDDISVTTHLPPAQRLSMDLDRNADSNILRPGQPLQVALGNYDALVDRSVRIVGGVYDWRGAAIVAVDMPVTLKSAQRLHLSVAPAMPAGAYVVRLLLKDQDRTLATIDQDVLVADLGKLMGEDWSAALADPWRLRIPIRDRYTLVDEDWDWVEHYPGNTQLDSIRLRAGQVAARGASPYLLLGYSAYWASGIGFDQLKAGAFVRRPRDIGHGVDVFLVPQRMEDWDQYVRQVLRGVGADMAGYLLWNNPDSSGSLRVEPAKLAQMLASADKWRRMYCPQTPLLIGGMTRDGAIPYLTELAAVGALDHLSGVNVRLDVGRLSPEDAEVSTYIRQLRFALSPKPAEPKTILLTDLDWAVEKDPAGVNGFDQAAYLIRATLLLDRLGIQPALAIRNEDDSRYGLGLTYRQALTVPPMTEKLPTLQLRPGWWGIVRTRQWLDQLKPVAEMDVRDVIPQRTRCLLFELKAGGKPVAIIWRNDDPGYLSFKGTGWRVSAAEDMLAAPVPQKDGWYAIGKMPAVFVLEQDKDEPGNPPASFALQRMCVRDGEQPLWPQRVLAAFTPATGQGHNYAQTGGAAASLSGRILDGQIATFDGLRFAQTGTERFEVDVPDGAALILRKRFLLDESGQDAQVLVNGQPAGRWNLKRADKQLSSGVRDAVFILSRQLLAGKPRATIELRYSGPANTISWDVLEHRDKDAAFPLTAMGALHIDQVVGHPQLARNMIGSPLKIGTTSYANGIGVFAPSLLEYSLNGQFSRFTAKVGVDAATEGRGSVKFEVYADGKQVWSSPIMSGLDQPKEIDLDVKGVDRLRLIVGDGGDGNKLDAADWCEPVFKQ